MTKHARLWRVEVWAEAQRILSIDEQSLGGVELAEQQVETIANAAQHLLAFIGRSEPAIEQAPVPISMVLYCPCCGEQHLDIADEHWANPPHCSHKCQHCGCIWRPADVPTNGVPAITTRGKSDTWTGGSDAALAAASVEVRLNAQERERLRGYALQQDLSQSAVLRQALRLYDLMQSTPGALEALQALQPPLAKRAD